MKNVFVIILLLSSSSLFAHKFYISIADMEYNEEKDRIDVSLKVTAHDFELMLSRKFGVSISIETTQDSSEVSVYYQAYIEQNFSISSGGQQANFQYLGKELLNREDLYFYFSFTNIANPSSLNIKSNLLFSISDDQQNIVHYKYKNQTKTVTLVPVQNEADIIFE